MKKTLIALAASAGVLLGGMAQAAELRDQHPDFYVVKKGDTLWDISAMFLTDPWLWPEIWQANPQVDNPHLIYPGDVLTLVYVDGQPRLVRGNTLPNGTVKLTPRPRVLSEGDAITTIPLEIIKPFLVNSLIVGPEDFAAAPYVVANDGEHLITGAGDRVYVRGVGTETADAFGFYRKGEIYRDPDTGEVLGQEARYLANGSVDTQGDPAAVSLEESVMEVLVGDFAFPRIQQPLRPVFAPHAPEQEVEVSLISVYGGVTQIGQYNVVVLNKGANAGMEPGHVLTVFRRGEVVHDRVASERNKEGAFREFWKSVSGKGGESVRLPDEEAGTLMIFRTFDKVSLALVMNATRPIHLLDKARTP